MAITLRNKPLEEKIKRIGRQRGLGPSAVIAKAVEALEQTPPPEVPPEEVERRKAFAAAFLAEVSGKTTEEERRAMREFEADMYDEHGLPK
ncbi:MAG: hypothetical protein JNK84_06300 [Phreatobacter sp.]|uniref:hypothetical protein n=1 Tax=Phreatobacter sp. TaxID=1966341 RepID=UPI001A604898|nr:hypothetical protein [Phreatobacter sp.]MBL8568680.1 hypothetical protein [Phreatobacter sp.]